MKIAVLSAFLFISFNVRAELIHLECLFKPYGDRDLCLYEQNEVCRHLYLIDTSASTVIQLPPIPMGGVESIRHNLEKTSPDEFVIAEFASQNMDSGVKKLNIVTINRYSGFATFAQEFRHLSGIALSNEESKKYAASQRNNLFFVNLTPPRRGQCTRQTDKKF